MADPKDNDNDAPEGKGVLVPGASAVVLGAGGGMTAAHFMEKGEKFNKKAAKAVDDLFTLGNKHGVELEKALAKLKEDPANNTLFEAAGKATADHLSSMRTHSETLSTAWNKELETVTDATKQGELNALISSGDLKGLEKAAPDLAKKVADATKETRTAMEKTLGEAEKHGKAWSTKVKSVMPAELKAATENAERVGAIATANAEKGLVAFLKRPYRLFKAGGAGTKFGITAAAVAVGALAYFGVRAIMPAKQDPNSFTAREDDRRAAAATGAGLSA